jgi:hypothetical protein
MAGQSERSVRFSGYGFFALVTLVMKLDTKSG